LGFGWLSRCFALLRLAAFLCTPGSVEVPGYPAFLSVLFLFCKCFSSVLSFNAGATFSSSEAKPSDFGKNAVYEAHESQTAAHRTSKPT